MSCEKENCLWASCFDKRSQWLSIHQSTHFSTINLLLFSHSSIALSTHLHLSIHLSINPSASIYAYLLTYSIYIAIHPSIHIHYLPTHLLLFIYLSISSPLYPSTLSTHSSTSIHLTSNLFTSLSIHPSIHLYLFTLSTHSYTSIHLFIHLFTHLSIHLSINIFIHLSYILFSFFI